MKFLAPGVVLYDVIFVCGNGSIHVALFTERSNAERFIEDRAVTTGWYEISERTLDEAEAKQTTL